jgi:hypothetical protein
MPMPTLLEFVLLITWAAAGAPIAAADDPSPAAEPTAGPSLDEQLFDDLSDELMEDLSPDSQSQPAEAGDSTDRELEQSLDQGEADEAGLSPLGKLSRRMREVEDRLGARQAGGDTQKLQQRIVGDIDALIEELQRKQRKSSQSQSSQGSQDSRRSQPKPSSSQSGSAGTGTTQTAQGDGPSRESTDAVRKDRQERPDLAEIQAQLKELWGHLPEKAREEMLQSSVDEFLPKYQLLIEEYFRRLVKERSP